MYEKTPGKDAGLTNLKHLLQVYFEAMQCSMRGQFQDVLGPLTTLQAHDVEGLDSRPKCDLPRQAWGAIETNRTDIIVFDTKAESCSESACFSQGPTAVSEAS